MSERGIIFTGESVRAILDDRKTQTRRVLRFPERPPTHQPGDLLWVREGCLTWEGTSRGASYKADYEGQDIPLPTGSGKWSCKMRTAMFMPRWASRLTLRATAVRVQRLQEISDADAEAEGVIPTAEETDQISGQYVRAYARTWDAIHRKHPERQWASNPKVVALTFERVRP